MTFPEHERVATTHGYHPLSADAEEMLSRGSFDELLVIGAAIPDVVDAVGEIRFTSAAEVDLARGLYWFSGVEPSAAMLVTVGSAPMAGTVVDAREADRDPALGAALGWMEHLWDGAQTVPAPRFSRGAEVITATGEDGIVQSREGSHGRWSYSVFAGGITTRVSERSLQPRPVADAPSAWIRTAPVSPERFAATLTRAKLDDHYTDTVFSFRATRTIFRPYQFKPVLKMLATGSLRMLIADEVGLGKTIEAGLLWTELEARRRADRVIVVCPSALVEKWRREMDERFGFELVELTPRGLDEMHERLESGRQPRRAAYICSLERLRTWSALGDVTGLGLQFDLAIVDEAHSFRNSDTKSHQLGEHLSQWADAMVLLSATPVNLRTGDLYNLLEIMVPGEFGDLAALEERIAPNAALHRVSGSLLDSGVTNEDRRGYLDRLSEDPLGRALMGRPDYKLLASILAQPSLTPHDVVRVKRLCSELHGLSAEITRTRKVEVREDKALRQPVSVPVDWTTAERAFYDEFYRWCVNRAAVVGMPLHFAMQMPLRLAGSCLPAAAESVLSWVPGGVGRDEDSARSWSAAREIPPSPELLRLARDLRVDTKFDAFRVAIGELVRQGKQTLVFTHSRRTLDRLSARLRLDNRIAVLHGGVAKEERHVVMADFRAGRYDVVIATRVASEGLDFEFCSALVNYDLPWNPMEVEQRIGRIDRIGQREDKILVLNFHTPGTIESDIVERVMDRIGVFEHAIGALEPILDSSWSTIEKELFDFTLSPEQREQRIKEVLAALEEQAAGRKDLEAAAPYLISGDGVDIEGLESDLVGSGRYVGQLELALLIADWATTYRGRTSVSGDVLSVNGNEEMASHVQRLVHNGERTAAEVDDVVVSLRNGLTIGLSLDQEGSRIGGVELLTATHPLVRAAVAVPGHRQGRLASLTVTAGRAGVAPGTYLTLLTVANWNGVRPLNEVWTASVDLETLEPVSETVGDAILAQLAEGSLTASRASVARDLGAAVTAAIGELNRRRFQREEELEAENDAIARTREVSARQVHERRLATLNRRIDTLIERGRHGMIPAARGQLARESARYEAQSQDLVDRHQAALATTDLAVCLVEVTR